ncbi:MAG: FGGY-family carbohydrate kinase [Hyphomicrobiales bacterium]|nr:FGGY-family carbohydrate kinase [Hyphomicrobiales bacterium]MDE2113351.1 FGGY-family carbohydrate kinase [Hyphomicrobiales bacterium]
MKPYYLGVDVGTGSVRAGVFDASGQLLGVGRKDIKIWRAPTDRVEQSAQNIWESVIASVRTAVQKAGIDAQSIAGIGFDATCSLVVLDPAGNPMAVGPEADPARNVIVWMDHRALDQTARINATGHRVLQYVGGAISPEMQTPKLLWLKENLPKTYASAGHFFDLSDYLTYRATGSLTRSICALACKWTYLAHEGRWADDFFCEIGLSDLSHNNHARIGNDVIAPGAAIGQGLTPQAAAELGLAPGIKVGASLIDAHAGALGTMGGRDGQGQPLDPFARMALIVGTSACCMTFAPTATFIPGLWGPYFAAIVDEYWLTEGGQSAAGAAVDYFIATHPKAYDGQGNLRDGLFAQLEAHACAESKSLSHVALKARDLHILPDINGNRSPLADPHMRGMMVGIGMDDSEEGLARLYCAALCGLAHGIADIVDQQVQYGLDQLNTIVISGGLAKSALVRQIIADATGCKVALPACEEPVLLGSAMLGAVAHGRYANLQDAMLAMSRDKAESLPVKGKIARFHKQKRRISKMMQQLDRKSRAIMRPF